MKKISLFLSIVLMILCFTSCGKSSVYYNGKYDEDKYTQTNAIKGTSIIIPKSIYDAKEPQSNLKKYSGEELSKHVFEASSDTDYMLYEPALFILYVFDLGTVEGIEEKQNLANIPAEIGTSKWLTFEERNPDKYTSINNDGNAQAVYSANISETITGTKAEYIGYVTILHNEKENHDYCMFVGFPEEKYDVAAETIANSFLLVK